MLINWTALLIVMGSWAVTDNEHLFLSDFEICHFDDILFNPILISLQLL